MKYVCSDCILDSYLRGAVRGHARCCSYCGRVSSVMSLEELSHACGRVLYEHFETTHTTMAVVHFDRTPEGHNLFLTLRDLTVVAEPVLDDLTEEVRAVWKEAQRVWWEEFDESDDDPWFKRRSGRHYYEVGRQWADMETSLHREARYLNRKAMQVLDEVFVDLHSASTEGGSPVVIEVGPGTAISSLMRARVFQTTEALTNALTHPAKHLGTPPAGVGQAGRMNAKGQPAFYGATDRDIAAAEVRPPVGSWVVTAKFDLMRPLKLLDLSALAAVQMDPSLSLFDPRSNELASKRDFLQTLARRLMQPVMPELQDRDYLITQVIADYLAGHPGGRVDGVLYPSVQVGAGHASSGRNVVLFPNSSSVEGADSRLEASVNLYVQEDDGPREWLDPEVLLVQPLPPDATADVLSRVLDGEPPAVSPSLQLDFEGIVMHEVKSVAVQKTSVSVSVEVVPERKGGEVKKSD